MATRFSAFATIKMLSLGTSLLDLVQDQNNFSENFAEVYDSYLTALTSVYNADGSLNSTFLKGQYNGGEDAFPMFRNVALATNVSISENYNTRSVVGIGNPTAPNIVPGNMNVTVSIARLTTDSRSIADYATKPSYFYNAKLQYKAITSLFHPNVIDTDLPFYTYIAVTDLEQQKAIPSDRYMEVNSYQLIAFMPRSYNQRLDSGTAEVVTDIEGEGKIMGLKEIIDEITGKLTV